MSYGKIAIKYDKCKATIQRIINSSLKPNLKRGPKEKLTKYDKRKIKTLVDLNSKKGLRTSCSSIKEELDLSVSLPTVFRTMKCLNFEYKNLPYKFKLSNKMKQNRIRMARMYLETGINWNYVVFSDEKRFSINGCDSFYNWMNKNQSPYRVKKIIKASGVMIWAMILPNGLLSYSIMKGHQNSEKYMAIIKERAVPIIKLNVKDDFIFQQDNCPIHVSRYSKKNFEECGITTLDWPPYSPELNIIENI